MTGPRLSSDGPVTRHPQGAISIYVTLHLHAITLPQCPASPLTGSVRMQENHRKRQIVTAGKPLRVSCKRTARAGWPGSKNLHSIENPYCQNHACHALRQRAIRISGRAQNTRRGGLQEAVAQTRMYSRINCCKFPQRCRKNPQLIKHPDVKWMPRFLSSSRQTTVEKSAISRLPVFLYGSENNIGKPA